MNKCGFLFGGLLLFAIPASASPITYNLTVNTSSIAGDQGSLDLNFNPGPLGPRAASLQILGFSSDGSLAGSPQLTGDVSGTLPSIVTFDNGTDYNDYFEDFTFGSTLSFDLSLYGPALSSPDGESTPGSTFAFSMFSDTAGTIPVLTNDTSRGFALIVDVNPDGSTSVTNYSDQTSVGSGAVATPEPGGLLLVATGLAMIALVGMRRRRQLRE